MSPLLAMAVSRVVGFLTFVAVIAAWLVSRWSTHRGPKMRPPPKPWWLYWFWRLYVPIVYIGVVLLVGKALVTLDEKLLTLVFAPCFILFLVAIVAILGNFAFTFDYGPFGKRRRGPLPDEPPLRTFRNSFGIIGGVRASLPLVTWLIYRRGIGVKVSTLGDVYLPLDAIEAIELENGLSSTLYHRSPEVRGSIRVPQHVARAIAELLGPQKVIVTADLAEKANWFQRLWQ